MQAEHYDRTHQQQIDIGLLAPEEAQAAAKQVLFVQCSLKACPAENSPMLNRAVLPHIKVILLGQMSYMLASCSVTFV